MRRDQALEREWLLHSLRQADAYVESGARHIVRQQEIVRELEDLGQDPNIARQLLVSYEALQRMRISQRDRLARKLGVLGSEI